MQDCFGRFYNVPRQPQAQQLAVLYFVFALSALFDPSLPAGANSEQSRIFMTDITNTQTIHGPETCSL